MKTKEQAEERAQTIVAALGQPWEYDVWNNFGWHFNIHTPDNRVKVHPAYGGDTTSWTAFVNHDGRGGGTWVGRGASIPEALTSVAEVMDVAQSQLDIALRSLRTVTSA